MNYPTADNPRVRRVAPALAAALALGLTGCHHGSNHQQATAPPAPAPYTPEAVRRAFARAGLPLHHDRAAEEWGQASSDRSTLAAFLTDETKQVQVSVYRPASGRRRVLVRVMTQGGQRYVTKTPGNLSVTYPTTLDPYERQVFPPFAPRVQRALSLLRQVRSGKRH